MSQLHSHVGCFNVRHWRVEAGIDPEISDVTVQRCLNSEGYKYLQACKKGLMTQKDVKKRVAYAWRVKSKLPASFWTEGISFYLDGASFVHKSIPLDQARCSSAMIWSKKSEGLKLQCTTKGKKTGWGGKCGNIIVAIAHKNGVVLCEQYTGRFTGAYFAEFIQEHFEEVFKISRNPRTKLFLQDSNPRQNSAIPVKAVYNIGARMFAILP